MVQRSTAGWGSKSLLSCLLFGVGHASEGVCLLLKIEPYRQLLDNAFANIKPLTQNKKPPIYLVFCSHAHSDLIRGLMALHQTYPQLPVYAS